MRVFGLLGIAHTPEIGAKRYVDAMHREGEYAEMKSCDFWSSIEGTIGPVGDQTKLFGEAGAQYGNISKQEAMYEALQSYA
jgi:hypothetical protein